MKSILAIKTIFVFSISICYLLQPLSAQNHTDTTKTIKHRNVVSILPSASPKSNGLQIGPLGSEVMCGYPYYKISNGLNIQILGQGALWMFYSFNYYKTINTEIDTTSQAYLINHDAFRAKHNGLLISLLGPYQTRVNGVCISLFYGQGAKLNGLALNLLRNDYNIVKGVELGVINEVGKIKGVQIGVINLAKEVKGFQFGLWNVNEKRKLPFINWSF